jgi:hypothetical protein
LGQLLVAFVLIAQTGRVDSPRSNSDLVTVSGCVRGSHLKLPSGTTVTVDYVLRASEFVLEGSKETLRAIQKDHDRHYLEVTGTLKLPAHPAGDVQVRQKQLGTKTRVTVGTREADQEIPTPVRLLVSSYRDLANQCHER